MHYVIEHGDTLGWLELQVKERLAQGWVPCGGLAVLPSGQLAQALFKPDPTALTPAAVRAWRVCNGVAAN